MKKTIIILFLTFVTACGSTNSFTVEKADCKCSSCPCAEVIEQVKAEELINKGAVLIDVRTDAEFRSGNIKGSINIPVETISNIDLAKDTIIIVYCRSGNRSSTAAKTLMAMGYKEVYDFGAYSKWR